LKGATKEMDKIGEEDKSDDYQRGVDNDENEESKRIQVWALTW
jgi:hypothetical protein